MATQVPHAEIGLKAPPFKLAATDGKTYSLADVKGSRGTLVMFICNHCPYVKASIDRAVADAEALSSIGIATVAICSNDAESYPEELLRQHARLRHAARFSISLPIGPTISDTDVYGGVISGPATFGTGARTAASSGAGDALVLNAFTEFLFVPRDYVSGASLSGSATFANATLASLGIAPGAYVYSWGSGANADTFTIDIAPTVPEPSTWALMLVGFGSLCFAGYKRLAGTTGRSGVELVQAAGVRQNLTPSRADWREAYRADRVRARCAGALRPSVRRSDKAC